MGADRQEGLTIETQRHREKTQMNSKRRISERFRSAFSGSPSFMRNREGEAPAEPFGR